MDWLFEFGVAIWDWFGDEDHQNRVSAIAAALTVILTIAGAMLGALWYVITRLISPRKSLQQMPEQPQTTALPQADVLSMDQHLTILEKREAKLEAKLATAHSEEKDLLQRQITELQAQIANPEESLAKAQKRITDLEALLDREANQIGADRIAEAKAALEQGDYSLADDIFAEIEAKNELAVQETARAAYGRGEVAEAEVRWADAYTHYANAARLDPSFDNLFKAREYAWRTGQYADAHRFGEALLAVARKEGTQEQIARAFNEHALTLEKKGRYVEAEGLYREALEIGQATIGRKHLGYAIILNNLALVVKAQGRYEEAEGLYAQVLETDRATIGKGHPDYAIHLNNLAMVVQVQGRYAEAEGIFREALEIDRATIGEGHPDYATHLNNLAGVVQAQGRYEEAEGLFVQALEIDRATLGEGHPDYATHLSNLAGVVREQGRYQEAEGLYREALEITREAVGEWHPSYANRLHNLAGVVEAQERYEEAEGLYAQALEVIRTTVGERHRGYAAGLGNLGQLLGQIGRVAEGREMLEQALEIFRATLPPDHPHIAETERRIAALP